MTEKKGILGIFHLIADKIERFIGVCVCIFIAVLGISVFVGVVGRNVNIPVVWLDEVSTYCCIWATFFGFALACKYNMHSNVDLLLHWLPKGVRTYFELFWMAFGVVFMGAVLWSSREYISFVYTAKTLSAQLRLPLAYIYMGPVIGYIFAVYFVTVNIMDHVAGMKKGKKEDAS